MANQAEDGRFAVLGDHASVHVHRGGAVRGHGGCLREGDRGDNQDWDGRGGENQGYEGSQQEVRGRDVQALQEGLREANTATPTASLNDIDMESANIRRRRPSFEGRSLYETLGVSKNATESEIKKKYYALARRLHPDKNYGSFLDPDSAADATADINRAKTVLLDKEMRQLYDNYGSRGLLAAEKLGSPSSVNSLTLWILSTGGALPGEGCSCRSLICCCAAVAALGLVYAAAASGFRQYLYGGSPAGEGGH